MSADMSRSVELREQLVELAGRGRSPRSQNVLTKLAASALMRHRKLNAEFVSEEVRIHPTANVGMAVATERGLVVPVIRGANGVDPRDRDRARRFVDRARSAKLQQTDLEGGTSRSRTRDVRRGELHRRAQPAAGRDPPSGPSKTSRLSRRAGRNPAADEPDADLRPPRRRRRGRRDFLAPCVRRSKNQPSHSRIGP